MAWTRKLPSGKYQARYRDPAGKVRVAPGGPFTHKIAAERAGASAEESSRAPGWRDPEAARRTWGEWCETWWPSRTVEGSTLKTDVGRRDNHLLPRWKDVPLCDITRHDIAAWAAQLRKTGNAKAKSEDKSLSASTVRRIVQLFASSLAAGVDAEIIDSNPAARLKIGGGTASIDRYLSRGEYTKIRAHLEPEWQLVADLLVGTGLRWGEAAGLHYQRVDLKRRTIDVIETWSQSKRTMKPYPKSAKPRTVPLPAWVELPADLKAGACTYDHTGPACRSGLVLTTKRGSIIDQPVFRRALIAACEAAEIAPIRIHDLRHTYASWRLQDGVELAEVGRLLGHKSPITTQRYAHLTDKLPATVQASIDLDPRTADTAAASATRASEKAAAHGLKVLRGGQAG